MSSWFDILYEVPYLIQVIYLVIIAVAAIIIERILTRKIKGIVAKTDLPPEVANGLILIVRIIIILGAVGAAFNVGGIPSDWLVSVSAVAGAAVGFASTRTIGNLMAGLYVMVSRPFKVMDYVTIGNIEGIVREITINYTRILTAGGQVVSISNQKILDQTVVNYSVESGRRKLYCYTFEVVFDHSLSADELDGIFERVLKRYENKLPKKIEYQLVKLTRLERTYRVHLHVKKPKEIFLYHPKVLDEIIREWEKTKAEKG